jgi:hypothetical protein
MSEAIAPCNEITVIPAKKSRRWTRKECLEEEERHMGLLTTPLPPKKQVLEQEVPEAGYFSKSWSLGIHYVDIDNSFWRKKHLIAFHSMY